MLHELCHLRHLDHGPAFQALLASLCPDHRECRRALREYKLI
jgi:predicted metal-dependent hydrolase